MPTNSPSCVVVRSSLGSFVLSYYIISRYRASPLSVVGEKRLKKRSNHARALTLKGTVERSSTGPAQREGTVNTQGGVCADARTLQAENWQENLCWAQRSNLALCESGHYGEAATPHNLTHDLRHL